MRARGADCHALRKGCRRVLGAGCCAASDVVGKGAAGLRAGADSDPVGLPGDEKASKLKLVCVSRKDCF